MKKHITKNHPNWKHHDNIFHSHKHENEGARSGTAKDMEILQSPVVEKGQESGGGAGQKKKKKHCWISALPPDCSQCVVRSWCLYTECIWQDASINVWLPKRDTHQFWDRYLSYTVWDVYWFYGDSKETAKAIGPIFRLLNFNLANPSLGNLYLSYYISVHTFNLLTHPRVISHKVFSLDMGYFMHFFKVPFSAAVHSLEKLKLTLSWVWHKQVVVSASKLTWTHTTRKNLHQAYHCFCTP